MPKRLRKLHGGGASQIKCGPWLCPFAFQAVDAPKLCLHLPICAAKMGDLPVIPIAKIDGAVGACLDIDRSKPRVAACQRPEQILCAESRMVRLELAANEPSLQRLDSKQTPRVVGGKRR